jgi:hypothetical protein
MDVDIIYSSNNIEYTKVFGRTYAILDFEWDSLYIDTGIDHSSWNFNSFQLERKRSIR